MPPPILDTHVAMIQLDKNLQRTPESSLRTKGISSLLTTTRHSKEENIKKIISLILDLWELAKIFSSLVIRIQNDKEYLNADLKNDEGFLTDGVAMFIAKISAMTEQMRNMKICMFRNN
jgi:hypothetical protein